MARWKLTLEYDGRAFCGWQRQDGQVSAQKILEDAVQKFCGESVTAFAAGRTDSGVHARGQVAHIDIAKAADSRVIENALNFHVRPYPISILSAQIVAEDFHARFSARGRRYLYRIVNRPAPLAIEKGLAWRFHLPLDERAMQKAGSILIGKHDFSAFRAANCQASSPVRTLDLLSVTRQDEEIRIILAARSFLYHQVRNIVGTLSFVGTGKWSLGDFRDAFESRDRRRAGPTAPADGLYFMEAMY